MQVLSDVRFNTVSGTDARPWDVLGTENHGILNDNVDAQPVMFEYKKWLLMKNRWSLFTPLDNHLAIPHSAVFCFSLIMSLLPIIVQGYSTGTRQSLNWKYKHKKTKHNNCVHISWDMLSVDHVVLSGHCNPYPGDHRRSCVQWHTIRDLEANFQQRDCLSRYRDSHYRDNAVVRPFYVVCKGNFFTDKRA